MDIHDANLQVKEYTQKPFTFTGKGGEFFGIWIVNIILTIITLGFYSAWAKVRTHQYFYGNTILDNSAFQYLASPLNILKGRIIATLLFGLYYALNAIHPIWGLGMAGIILALVPAIIVSSMSFRMRNTAYRNVTFRFEQNFKQAYTVFAGPILFFGLLFAALIIFAISQNPENLDAGQLAKEEISNPPLIMLALVIAMFLAFPFWEYLKTKFIVANTRFGTSPFKFETHASSFYRLYILSFLLFIGVVITFGFISYALGVLPQYEAATSGKFTSATFVLGIIPFYLWAFAYIQTKKTNLIFNNTTLNGMPLQSDLTVTYMSFLYVTNTLAIMLSFGLLIPWTMIRSARYRASTLSLLADTSLDNFVADQRAEVSAFGEEFGEVFDIDVGL